MPGTDNNISFGEGYRLQASDARAAGLCQRETTDVGILNNDGTPEGAVSANPGSLCCDRTNGVIYYKNTGTGNTGWVLNGSTQTGDIITQVYQGMGG